MLYFCGSWLLVSVACFAWLVWQFIHAVEEVEDLDGFHRNNDV